MVNPSLCQALRCPLLAKSFHDHVNTLKVLPSWNQTLQITHLPLKNLHSPLDHSTHSHPPVISQTIAVWFPDTALHTAGHSMEPKSGLLWWDFHACAWQWPSVCPSGHPLMHPLAIWPSTLALTLPHKTTCRCYHHRHHHTPHIITHTTTYDMTIVLSPHIAHVHHTTTYHTHIHTCITTTQPTKHNYTHPTYTHHGTPCT